jgi:hypothetical protein
VTLSKNHFEVESMVGYQKPKPRQFVQLRQERKPEPPKEVKEAKEVKEVKEAKETKENRLKEKETKEDTKLSTTRESLKVKKQQRPRANS